MAALLDPKVLAAVDAQAALVRDWLSTVSGADLDRPSSLSGWRLAELVFHLGHGSTALADALAAPRPPTGTTPLSIAGYTSAYANAAGEIADRERDGVRGMGREELIAFFDAEFRRMHDQLEQLDGRDVVVTARRGPIRASDMLRTRATELVAHSIDAQRSLPPGPELASSAIKVVVRMLAEILAERYPGRSIEMRIPPYAAVQCGPPDGPTHTRGTPPTVVECPPLTFIALGCGRTTFAAAVDAGEVRASGARADLSAYLPLLA